MCLEEGRQHLTMSNITFYKVVSIPEENIFSLLSNVTKENQQIFRTVSQYFHSGSGGRGKE